MLGINPIGGAPTARIVFDTLDDDAAVLQRLASRPVELFALKNFQLQRDRQVPRARARKEPDNRFAAFEQRPDEHSPLPVRLELVLGVRMLDERRPNVCRLLTSRVARVARIEERRYPAPPKLRRQAARHNCSIWIIPNQVMHALTNLRRVAPEFRV